MPLLYCPECKVFIRCTVPSNPTSYDYHCSPRDKAQRQVWGGLQVFERLRKCDNGHEIITYEVFQGELSRLLRDRELLKQIWPIMRKLTTAYRKFPVKRNRKDMSQYKN